MRAQGYIYFPGLFFIFFSYFGSFMVVLGFGLILGFWDWGFQLMRFGACGVGPTGFFWVEALPLNFTIHEMEILCQTAPHHGEL